MSVVFQIQRYCIRDGSGIRTCVFFKGCPLHCPWCHNPEGISPLIQTDCDGRVYGREMTAAEIYAEVVKDKKYYDISGGGVTFTGGEPLMSAELVAEAAELCKRGGISVALETSGAVSRAAIDKVLPYVDCVLFDIKSFDKDKLFSVTGAKLDTVTASLEAFAAAVPVVLRAPVIPGFNDDDGHFEALGALAAKIDASAVELLPYHGLGADKSKKLGMPVRMYETVDADRLNRAADIVRRNFDRVSVL